MRKSAMRKSLGRLGAWNRSRKASSGAAEAAPELSAEDYWWTYKGVSLDWLKEFHARLQSGEEAEDVELVVFLKDVGGIPAGSTARKVGADGRKALGNASQLEVVPRSDTRVTLPVCVPSAAVRNKPRAEWQVADVCEYAVRSSDDVKRLQSSFVQVAVATDAVGADFEGAFVCHSPGSRFCHLVEALAEHFAAQGVQGSRAFVWLELFGANLSLSPPNDSLATAVRAHHDESATKFDSFLVFMDSWLDPLPLHRIGCVGEIFAATLADKVDPRPLYRPDADSDFVDALMTDNHEAILKGIVDFDMEKQTLSREDSQLQRTISKTMGGMVKLNYRITARIRVWLEETAMRCVAASEKSSSEEAHAELLNQVGLLLKNNGQYDLARKYLDEGLQLRDELFGPDSLQLAESYSSLAQLLHDTGEQDAALEAYTKAADIRERAAKAADAGISDVGAQADAMCKIAVVLQDQRKFQLSLDMYEKALALLNRDLSAQSKSAGIVLHQMGVIMEEMDMRDAAIKLYERALAIYNLYEKNHGGQPHPVAASTLTNLGGIHADRGEFQRALKFYKAALAIDVRVCGDGHPAVAIDLANLGHAYQALGKFDKAQKALSKALGIRSKALGPKHPQTQMLRIQLTKVRGNVKQAGGGGTVSRSRTAQRVTSESRPVPGQIAKSPSVQSLVEATDRSGLRPPPGSEGIRRRGVDAPAARRTADPARRGIRNAKE